MPCSCYIWILIEAWKLSLMTTSHKYWDSWQICLALHVKKSRSLSINVYQWKACKISTSFVVNLSCFNVSTLSSNKYINNIDYMSIEVWQLLMLQYFLLSCVVTGDFVAYKGKKVQTNLSKQRHHLLPQTRYEYNS